ncbi:MAG TPA: tRNA pseudouridine(38-40) synthase TruA [Chlamydiales bacterium]|jgi:tRNA pseudouridine38-40 synthase
MRYLLTIAYDGTAYAGWQVQSNATAIQPLIQKALEIVLRHPLDLTGAGRTDSGVHAIGQTAHFDTEISFHETKFLLSLNALLPPDIRIFSIQPVTPRFHARYDALGKIYQYHIHLDKVFDPFTLPYRFHLLDAIERDRLFEGAPLFLGTRDFVSFANEAHKGTAAHDSVRTLKRFDVIEEKGGVRLELEADGFLYKMVRNLVGTLLDFAKRKISAPQIEEIFAAKDRQKAGPAVPPQGLFLVKVHYTNYQK